MDEVRSESGRCTSRALSMVVGLLLFSSLVFGQHPLRAGGQPSEYAVKAAFLLNFTKFVEWPKVERAANSPFLICILGTDPFGTAIDQIMSGEQVSGRPIAVERVTHAQPSCAVLFIARSDRDIGQILKETGPGTLTVGETEEFLRLGGMINFALDNRRVRFDVNLRAAAKASLQISSRLLSVARTVVK